MIDFHVHSTFSDGEKDVRTIIDLAVQRGITDLAITLSLIHISLAEHMGWQKPQNAVGRLTESVFVL